MILVSAVAKLMVQFDNNTNLVNSLFRLIRVMISSGQFVMFAMPSLFPMIIVEAESSVRNAMTATSLAFLIEVEESRSRSKSVDKYLRSSEQFCAFEERFLKRYMTQRKQPYGGLVTSVPPKDSCPADVKLPRAAPTLAQSVNLVN
jgi:hypothetical protein